MDRPRFIIEAAEVESMAKNAGLTVPELLPTFVDRAKRLARVPISNFHVGAIGLGPSGRVFFGVNLEFPDLPLSYSVHAEQFLVTNLWLNSEPHLDCVAVSAAPCGHCRQFFQEIRGAQDIKVLVTSLKNDESSGKFIPLKTLLPHRFGPPELLPNDTPLVLEQHHNGLSLTINQAGNISPNLVEAALEAANMSHAPYSQCPSGVAVMDSEGKIYRGWYMESAAYNPSMGPVRAALVDYIVKGGGGYENIVAAVLMEKKEGKVKQEQTARLLLQSISPEVNFRVFFCKSGKCQSEV